MSSRRKSIPQRVFDSAGIDVCNQNGCRAAELGHCSDQETDRPCTKNDDGIALLD